MDSSNFTFFNSKITGLSSVVGNVKVNIDDEVVFYQSQKQLDKLKKTIGFDTRYIADTGVTASDLCLQAAQQLLSTMRLTPSSLDAIVFVTQTPDYNMPGNAHIIHKKLELPKHCIAYDLVFGCSGFVTGLFMAQMMATTGFNKVLLLCGDTLSKIIDVRNRADAPIFGDAGSACVVEKTAIAVPSYFSLFSDGSGFDTMWQQAGGFRMPLSPETSKEFFDDKGNLRTLEHFFMDGFEVFNFTLTEQPDLLSTILNYSGKTPEQVDFFILHQANKYIIETIITKSNIPLNKAPHRTFSKYGNQSSASIPTTICEELASTVSSSCVEVVLQGYGSGLSWAACQTSLDNIVCLQPEIFEGGK